MSAVKTNTGRNACATLLVLLCGCTRYAETPGLADEIARIRAVDHHAHPALPDPKDRDFDAMPVDNLEASSDVVYMRPGAPGVADARRALFPTSKQQVMREKGDAYPAWVLDQIGVAVMFANRVTTGPGIGPPRFVWVPFADALMLPLSNAKVAAKNSDRKAFFSYEDKLLKRYLTEAGLESPPPNLSDFLSRVVTPTLERHRKGGAVAEKFEVAYLRVLDFDKADRATAERIYTLHSKDAPSEADYKPLQDFLFRYIAVECGRLGMPVHIHAMAGGGSYFNVQGANPLLLESVLEDPELRKTKFVMVHGGWPFTREIAALLTKPNAYLDFSNQSLMLPPATLAKSLREWLELVPEKVMFGTDAYPNSDEMGWEEAAWLATRRGREALTIALESMMREDGISRERALELARMVLQGNAQKLYGLAIDAKN